MNRDDLLRLLDLSGKEATPTPNNELFCIPDPAKTPTATSSLTAIKLDGWGLRRGDDLLSGSDRLRSLGLETPAAADFLAAAFEPSPELAASCVEPERLNFLTQLLQTPDYHALHADTALNTAASEIAATAFAEQYASLKNDRRARPDHPPGETKPAEGDDMATLRAVGRALRNATEEVEVASEAAAALGMGPGSAGSNDAKTIAALYRRVRDNPTLRRICTLAGRYRRVALSQQRQKSGHGLDDLVGVTLDGDVGRLLPHELAKLALPELEMDTLRRIVERQAASRLYRGAEPVGKGPVIVVVDESGSMIGDKIHTAKALALTLAWIARRQRRWAALVAYSGDSGERLLPLPPGRWDEGLLMDWLLAFLGRGSHLDLPIREMPDYHRNLNAPRGKTDLIFLTDALCHIPEDLQERFLTWKREARARLISLVLDSPPGDLASISDEVHRVRSLDVGEAAVQRVLSL